MQNSLSRIERQLPARTQKLIDRAAEISKNQMSKNTRRMYLSAIKSFEGFCEEQELDFSLPGKIVENGREVRVPFKPAKAQWVILYVTALVDAGAKWNTIKVHVAAIKKVHELNSPKEPSPTDHTQVKLFLKAVRNEIGVKVDKKDGLLADDIRRMVELTDDTLSGLRDKLVILLAFNAWLRSCNLEDLEWQDLDFRPNGVLITVRREKQDQEGEGRTIFIENGAAVKTLLEWKKETGLETGRVLRAIDRHGNIKEGFSKKSVYNTIKSYATAIGKDPEKIGAHSTRRGGATTAHKNGMPYNLLKKYGGWKSDRIVEGYIQIAEEELSAASYLL